MELNINTFKKSITNLYKDELANVFDPDKPCSWGLARNCGCHWQLKFNTHFLKIFTDLVGKCPAWDVPFAPYILASFFILRHCNYLFRETLTNKVDKTKRNKVSVSSLTSLALCLCMHIYLFRIKV